MKVMLIDNHASTDKLEFAGMPPRAMRYELWFFLVHPLGPSTMSCYK